MSYLCTAQNLDERKQADDGGNKANAIEQFVIAEGEAWMADGDIDADSGDK